MASYQIKQYHRLTDEDLAELYRLGRDCGALSVTALDFAGFDQNWFWLFARRAEVFAAVEGGPGRFVGFFYLTDLLAATARIHFCLFREGRRRRASIARDVLGWCFAAFEFQSLTGIVPVINQGAARFARECGGRELGLIPGACFVDRLRRAVGGQQFLFLPDNRSTER